jgi:hypothetical protein
MTAFLPPSADMDVDSQLYDNVYQSSSNQLVSATRVLTGQCSKINLPTFQLGSQTTIDLPNNMLLGHTTLNLSFDASKLPTGGALSQGWGYEAIDWMEYQFANSERLRIEGSQMFIKNVADVESGEKKKSVVALGGEVYNGVKPVAPADKKKITAYVSLYLPFSNLSSARVLPYDSTILSRPVQLTIQFKPARDLFTASTDAIAAGIIYPDKFTDAYIMCKTMVMIDGPSDSIRSKVALGGGEKYTYGYIYPLAYTSADIKTGVSATDPGKVSFKLERFLNGSLQSIDVFCERLTAATQAVPFKGSTPYSRQANYVPISNAELIFSGQCIWRSDDRSDQLMNLSEYPTNTAFDVGTFVNQSTVGEYTNFTGQGYWLHIQLSQLNERIFTNLTETGVVLVSNQVLLEFNTPEIQEYDNPAVTDGNQPLFRLHCVYNYQAGVRVADGSAHLVFQPPQQALPSIAGAMGVL